MEDIEKVIIDNLPLVHYVLNNYFFKYRKDEDLIQIGTISLWRAATHYDPSKGIKFSTYATKCIYLTLLKEIRKIERTPTTISLDTPQDCNEDYSFLDLVEDPVDYISSIFIKDGLNRAYGVLSERDKEIIKMICEGYKYSEIAEVLGISRSRVGVLVKNIVKIFKKYLEM